MILIRAGLSGDVETLCSIDRVARQTEERREFIRTSVADGACLIAETGGGIAGYGVLNYAFYHQGCIDMLYVADGQRRQGIGRALIEEMERRCQTPKLFTSTNLSNLPMQSLLARCDYVLSGVIHNLDEDDPEIVYFKRLR